MKLSFLYYFHVILLSLSFVIMIISTIFVIKKRKNWFTNHKKGMRLSIIFMILGISSMFILKIANNYPHFSTPHSQFGLLLLILAIMTSILGNFIKIKFFKITHKVIGGLVIVSGILVIIGQLLEHLE